MRISPRDKLILVAVAIAVVAVIAVVLLIVPQFKTIATIDQQIQQATREVDEANALLQQRQEMKDRAAQTDAAYLRLANSVPETPELPSLIIELQDVALQAGVSFEALRPEDPITNGSQAAASGQQASPTASTAATAADYTIMPIQLSIRGTWSDTIDFMNRLQGMTRAVRIVEYSSSADTGNTQEEASSDKTEEFTNFKLEAYSVPSGASATSVAVPVSN